MATDQLPPTEHQTIADLVRRMINSAQGLIDAQVALAKQELKDNAVQLAKASGMLAAGGVLLFLTIIFLLITIILGVEALWSGWGWLAALIITLLLGTAGGVLVWRGKDRVMINPIPRTRETLKEDLAWVRRPLTPISK